MGKLGLVFSIVLAASAFGFAQGKKAAPLVCPVCKMALATKKSAANPIAVKLTKKGKTYYCCGKCTMPANLLVKPKK